MSPFAAVGFAMIAGVAVIAVFFGAICGIICWKLKGGLLLGALSVPVMYFLLIALLDFRGLKAAAYFGAAPLLLTFFAGNLAARCLAHRRDKRPIWIGLVGFGLALIVGFVYLRLLGVILGIPFR